MKLTKNIVVGLCAFLLVMGTTAKAEVFTSFSQLGDFSITRGLQMASGDNLLVNVNGVDKSVVDAGYGVGSWNLGLLDEDGYVVGWAMNSSLNPSKKGWLTGLYSGSATYGLANGEKPSQAILVYDSTDNGWTVANGMVGSQQDLIDGDLFFVEGAILFDGVRGDVSALPIYPISGSAILPNMIVKPQSDLEDLVNLSDSWLSNDCNELNANCYGADWNKDTKVDFNDFSRLSVRWENYIP